MTNVFSIREDSRQVLEPHSGAHTQASVFEVVLNGTAVLKTYYYGGVTPRHSALFWANLAIRFLERSAADFDFSGFDLSYGVGLIRRGSSPAEDTILIQGTWEDVVLYRDGTTSRLKIIG